MIRYILILLLPFALYASKILSYNIYDRSDRVDVMITFDTPYDGALKQSISKSKIIIKLEDSTIESSKLKQLSSKYLSSLTITPMSGYTQIIATVPASVKLKASKTSDAYGLRLRFSDEVAQKNTKQSSILNKNPLESLPTKQDDDMSQSYYVVIAVLIIGIAILIFIKMKVTPNRGQTQNGSNNKWLFKSPDNIPQTTNNSEVTIRFQKSINSENSVVMLDFGIQSYLVLMGTNNILLDKFTDNKPATQEDFETILKERHQELDEFLKVEKAPTQQLKEEPKEPLQAYKERAASIMYEA